MGRQIAAHYTALVEHMDARNGLLGALFSADVISLNVMKSLRATQDCYQLNAALLQRVIPLSHPHLSAFIQALRQFNQGHLADLILGLQG